MLNPLTLYAATGRAAARAVNQGDGARARFENDYLRRMLRMERDAEARNAARAAFDAAYREARRV